MKCRSAAGRPAIRSNTRRCIWTACTHAYAIAWKSCAAMKFRPTSIWCRARHLSGVSADALRGGGRGQEERLLREAVRHRSGEPAAVHGGGEEVGRAEADGEIRRPTAFAGLVPG